MEIGDSKCDLRDDKKNCKYLYIKKEGRKRKCAVCGQKKNILMFICSKCEMIVFTFAQFIYLLCEVSKVSKLFLKN